MAVPSKLRTASSVMAWLSLAFAVLLVIAVPVGFLAPDLTLGGMGRGLMLRIMEEGVTASIPFPYRAGAMVVAAIPVALAVWGLISLYRLFRFYAAGKVFEAESLKCLNLVTALLFWFVLARIVCTTLKDVILHLPSRELHLAISFSTTEFGMLFLAGVALVISRVMAEAKRLADENATFI